MYDTSLPSGRACFSMHHAFVMFGSLVTASLGMLISFGVAEMICLSIQKVIESLLDGVADHGIQMRLDSFLVDFYDFIQSFFALLSILLLDYCSFLSSPIRSQIRF